MHSPYKKIRITDIFRQTRDAKTFVIELVDKSVLPYQAGQFITLIFPKRDGKEDRRSYSFSSAPETDPKPAITLKRVENGEYSRQLIDHARKGDEILTIGASGYFTMPENHEDHNQLVFIAAGSGIAPVYSLIKSALIRKSQQKLILIYSNHSAEHTIFLNELRNLQQQHKERFKIEFLFSSAPDLGRARLGKWLLEKLLKEYVEHDLKKALFFLCGPFDYMRMAIIVLQTEGVPVENIRKENFSSVKPRYLPEPPDKREHYINIIMDGNRYSFKTQFPNTILQSAKKAGIILPYSCEAGQCGTCAMTCVSGETWMSNNEVLVDSEIRKGRTLTCTGYPVGGDVTLKL